MNLYNDHEIEVGMQPNPVLRKLGFSDRDRVVILHADDVGMCQATVYAFSDLVDFGLISSAALMAPCPWFFAAAAVCREKPAADVGIHLTLTSEWETYRWGPLSTRGPASGLVDSQGCFFRTRAEAQQNARPEAVAAEIQAQYDRVVAEGIQPTHMDTHMGVIAHPNLIPTYIGFCLVHRLPPMIFRMDVDGWLQTGLDLQTAQMAVQQMNALEEQGMPLLDHLRMVPLDTPENRLERVRRMLSELEPGITHFIVHPAKDTPELRAITPDWACRVADYQVFTSDEMRVWLRDSGLQVIGYRAIQDCMGSSG